ncbi:MAG: ABC transporter ATP-binding protein [Candidatus Micrarchaeota archaeon]|nr:ABC transporter ATP-binding protein [Candidatus Micrarchaeota archaeon]MDE1848355.1 ABC transporter ATP-binding protein [Candidatus Micrarchaeota archaeon]MDE1864960.1 ABC transporter ATP-binding protein [Candidatus Micrarchaeota archaeon]
MIEVKNLTKKYADGTVALDRLSLRLNKRITAVLGRNGAGKTTAIRILSTQLLPTSGSASINGLDIVSDAGMVRDVISSIPQEIKPMGIANSYDHVAMYLNARGIPSGEIDSLVESALRDLNLWHIRKKPTADLSGGMRRKVFVAMALASKAQVIFLDEPTTGLDPISRMEVWAAIKKVSGTIVITTHYMEEAKELAQEIVLIDHGKKLAQGTVPELLRRFEGKVRVDGARGKYKIGTNYISYIKSAEAKKLLGKGYSIKQVGLEDLFVIRGDTLES